MQVRGRWDEVLAEFGNTPELNQGDVVIELVEPIDGLRSVIAASEQLIIAAEAGMVLGVICRLMDKRRLLIPWGNVAGIIDAPAGEARS
jgi:hypothetical protein